MLKQELSRRRFVGGALAVSLGGAAPHSFGADSGAGGKYCIERIELYTRLTPPGRMAFAIGKQDGPPPKPLSNPIGHVRMVMRDAAGNRTFGCSGERLSVRWLDKRTGRDRHQKLTELVELIETARRVYLEQPWFDNPFDKWIACYESIHRAGRAAGQVDLTSSFASSLMERAMLDGVCRLAGKSLFQMVREDRIGFRPDAVHPKLADMVTTDFVPSQPVTYFHIRHTIGLTDPLVDADIPANQRVNDGLPETLEEYVEADGLTHFKIKIQGEPRQDLTRLEKIWNVLPKGPDLLITLDANEMFKDVAVFEHFVLEIKRKLPRMLDAIAWFEQPMPRALSLDAKCEVDVRRVSRY